jgi:CheY-like chemotaxis protein
VHGFTPGSASLAGLIDVDEEESTGGNSHGNGSRDSRDNRGSRRRALLVDDTPSDIKLLKVLLQRQGLVCDEAKNGAIAVDMIWRTIRHMELGAPPSEGYDVVFMNAHMPVMDGLTATRIIRADLRFRSIIVGCTGDTSEHEVEGWIEAGADFVLPKPVRLDQLERLVGYAESVHYTSVGNGQVQQGGTPRVSMTEEPRCQGVGEGFAGRQERLRALPKSV